jgi:hypothetical protein
VRKLFTVCAAALLGIVTLFGVAGAHAQMMNSIAQDVHHSAAPPPATLALDGSNGGSVIGSTTLTITLTTTKTNDIIVVGVGAGGSSVTSVSDTAGLTWAHRATNPASGNRLETWWALSPGVLSSDTISVNFATLNSYEALAFGVNGAHTAAPWDSNAALPATAGFAGAPSISTSNAKDFIFGMFSGASGLSPGAGWTTLQAFSFSFTEYQIVTATQSGLIANYSGGSGTVQSSIGDAIVAGP